MAELNDQYLNSLKVALFQFTRESSNFTSVLSEVFDNLNTSSTKSSKQIDNSTKSVKGFGDAISSSSTYLKDFKTYVSNNSKNIVESSKAVKEYTSQLAELKQKSVDINRNWGALNSALKNNIDASESYTRYHKMANASALIELRNDYRQTLNQYLTAQTNGVDQATINTLNTKRKQILQSIISINNIDFGKNELNAQIKKQNQELYTNIYDTFGNSLLKIDSLINEKTSAWKGLKGGIDTLAKDAFKDTSLNISKEFQKNGIPGLHDYNKALAEALLSLERTGGVIDESNFAIIDKFQQFAEKVGDSSDAVKNINNALNAHVESIVKGAKPEEAKTSINGDIVNKLTESYQGNIEALEKFSKSINKTFTKHQIAFSTIIDKQLSEQSNIFGKFIYNFGKGAVQGGAGGSEGMTNALNEFTGTMRAGLLPALRGIIDTSKGFIKRETDAFSDFIDLDRTSAFQQQMGEEETIKLLSDTKPIWQTMEGGIGEFNEYQSDLLETAKKTLGTNVEQRQAIQKSNFENLRALGLLSHTVDESANTELLKSMMTDMQKNTAGGGLSLQAQSEVMNTVMKSSAMIKSAGMLDKERKRAQYEEIQNTIKFASALKMTTEQASTVATALATMNTNVTRQQMVSNVGTFGQIKQILDSFGTYIGKTSGISDADMNKMSGLLQTKSNRPEDQEFIRDTMFTLIGGFKDQEMELRTKMDEARQRGDTAAEIDANEKLARLDDIVSERLENFSGPLKDIAQKFAESYPTSKEEYAKIESGRKEGETFQQAMVRYVDEQAKKNITKQDTPTNNFEKSVTDFGNYVTAFGKNIFGANVENLFTVMVNAFAGIAEFGIAARAITAIVGTGGAVAGSAGLGASAVAVLPELLAALGIAGGVALFAYGAKGLYDHFTGKDIIFNADRGDAIHGIVDVNNLDIYTNQVTDAIVAQTQELLAGYTTVMGKPVVNNEPIYGMVDVNNLDVYTNQVTTSIDNQTKELLKGFTTIIGNPVDIDKAINSINTENTKNINASYKQMASTFVANQPVYENTPLTDLQVKATEMSMAMGNELSPIVKSAYELAKSVKEQPVIINETKKETPVSTDTSIPFQGYKPYNPPNGNTNIEQPKGILPSETINNTDISLALEDLKTFLTKELIVGLMEVMTNISINTGDTAKNTGDTGTFSGLVDMFKRPASQPFVRGPVENAATITS